MSPAAARIPRSGEGSGLAHTRNGICTIPIGEMGTRTCRFSLAEISPDWLGEAIEVGDRYREHRGGGAGGGCPHRKAVATESGCRRTPEGAWHGRTAESRPRRKPVTERTSSSVARLEPVTPAASASFTVSRRRSPGTRATTGSSEASGPIKTKTKDLTIVGDQHPTALAALRRFSCPRGTPWSP